MNELEQRIHDLELVLSAMMLSATVPGGASHRAAAARILEKVRGPVPQKLVAANTGEKPKNTALPLPPKDLSPKAKTLEELTAALFKKNAEVRAAADLEASLKAEGGGSTAELEALGVDKAGLQAEAAELLAQIECHNGD